MRTCTFWRMAWIVPEIVGLLVLGLHGLFPSLSVVQSIPPALAANAASNAHQNLSGTNSTTDDPFAVQMYEITEEMGLEHVVDAGVTWVRRNALLWSHAEPTKGMYEWNSQPLLQQELIEANTLGINVILVVRSTPLWARQDEAMECGRIKTTELTAFGNFLYEAVKRYSMPPYQVKFWQIWNEPDIIPSESPSDAPHGCWGDESDPYYGGEYYAEVLKAVYPRIKAADPQATVIGGGLLMVCDTRRDSCQSRQANYLEGILRNGGGEYMDVLAFNGYDFYYGGLGQFGNPHWGNRWNEEGPVLMAKLDFVRNLLAQYNGSGKALMATEIGLVCGATGTDAQCLTSDFENTKAYYLTQLYTLSLAENMRATTWYSLTGWRGSGLLDAQQNPLPAYHAFAFAKEQMDGAVFSRQVTEYPSVRVFEFERPDRWFWVLWSQDGSSHTVSLRQKPDFAWDAFGTPVEINALEVEIGLKPLYLEWGKTTPNIPPTATSSSAPNPTLTPGTTLTPSLISTPTPVGEPPHTPEPHATDPVVPYDPTAQATRQATSLPGATVIPNASGTLSVFFPVIVMDR